MTCPLCHGDGCSFFHRDRNREYYQCHGCSLVFVPPEFHLSPDEEKKRYDLHNNDSGDQGYRDFLRKLLLPVRDFLNEGERGLDFGSGPVPLLSSMLKEEGYETDIFDRFYANNPDLLSRQYDFITASEVVEHLRDPHGELDRLYRLLKPGGILGIMTGMFPGRKCFGKWHYKGDKTHIGFFSPDTFRWLAEKWSAETEFSEGDVVILRKPGGTYLSSDF